MLFSSMIFLGLLNQRLPGPSTYIAILTFDIGVDILVIP